ncbi:MAG: DUF47 family protein [Candidatus Lokiarchaeota archaeon]|nr:DUF47 family protein [Candidatus Lokiarchaeota archaeon]MBD3338943.1 DUF47 family protein [Candidatus Lokiarchaeota archaeon]
MKIKDKKEKIESLNTQFIDETLKGAEIFKDLFCKLIQNKLDKEEINLVIESERKCDRLKEQYIELLFKDKRALPFLVEDRYKIIQSIDVVNDKLEFLARYIEIYPFEIYQDLRDDFNNLCELSFQTVKELINCLRLIETDFDGAYKKTFKIESLKRKARTLRFNLLGVLYKKSDSPLRVTLTSKLVIDLYDIISWSEETSDYLRGLIIKYPSL